MARLAGGLADDLLATEVLAFDGPIFVAPAMNPNMYASPATRRNVKLLKEDGRHLIGPVSGETSCGEFGFGRMCEPSDILEQVAFSLARSKNSDPKKVLISVGPTLSAIDPVRYITNRSSGKMGPSLAWAASLMGHDVTVVTGPVGVEFPTSASLIRVETAGEMLKAVVDGWPDQDYFISSAAVLDWSIGNFQTSKIKKESGAPDLDWDQSPDILKEVSRRKLPHQKILGFAAETDDILENAQIKLASKGCHAIFANSVSHALESDFNSGWWIEKGRSPVEVPKMEKFALAGILIQKLLEMKTSKIEIGLTRDQRKLKEDEVVDRNS